MKWNTTGGVSGFFGARHIGGDLVSIYIASNPLKIFRRVNNQIYRGQKLEWNFQAPYVICKYFKLGIARNKPRSYELFAGQRGTRVYL